MYIKKQYEKKEDKKRSQIMEEETGIFFFKCNRSKCEY